MTSPVACRIARFRAAGIEKSRADMTVTMFSRSSNASHTSMYSREYSIAPTRISNSAESMVWLASPSNASRMLSRRSL
jgi:hypothetical protein